MKLVYRIVLIFAFILCLAAAIAYARGYRLDLTNKTLSSTGILAISSSPKAAKVFVNGELKGASDINITLPPGSYEVEIKKDGYTGWKKKISLKGELVMSLEALLFPLNASLSPLTNLGIVKAVPLDQTDRILLFTDVGDELKDGIYLFEAGRKPLSLLSPLKLIALKKNLLGISDLSSLTVILSPDFKEAIIESSLDSLAYLLSLEEENISLFDITNSKDTLIEAWNTEREKDHLKILEAFPKEFAKIASDSFHIIAFSPNETKLLYSAKRSISLPPVITPPLIASNQTQEIRNLEIDHIYVYDKKEDKNYELLTLNFQLSTSIQWYPDSKHLVFNESKKISVIDYDGNNKQTVYSGPFEQSYFTITGDGGLTVLSNLNPEANKFPDLYAVGIK